MNLQKIIKDIEDKYISENPYAEIITIKVINGNGWYWNKAGEQFKIFNIPDKFHSELWEENAYYLAEGDYKWMYLFRESDIEVL
jgi:hypothetical protein